MIAPTKIIAGLGMSLGMQCLHVPGATGDLTLDALNLDLPMSGCLSSQVITPVGAGDYRTALHAKAEAAADALVNGATDMVFLHIKAVDDTGHDRLTALKVVFPLIALMPAHATLEDACPSCTGRTGCKGSSMPPE